MPALFVSRWVSECEYTDRRQQTRRNDAHERLQKERLEPRDVMDSCSRLRRIENLQRYRDVVLE